MDVDLPSNGVEDSSLVKKAKDLISDLKKDKKYSNNLPLVLDILAKQRLALVGGDKDEVDEEAIFTIIKGLPRCFPSLFNAISVVLSKKLLSLAPEDAVDSNEEKYGRWLLRQTLIWTEELLYFIAYDHPSIQIVATKAAMSTLQNSKLMSGPSRTLFFSKVISAVLSAGALHDSTLQSLSHGYIEAHSDLYCRFLKQLRTVIQENLSHVESDTSKRAPQSGKKRKRSTTEDGSEKEKTLSLEPFNLRVILPGLEDVSVEEVTHERIWDILRNIAVPTATHIQEDKPFFPDVMQTAKQSEKNSANDSEQRTRARLKKMRHLLSDCWLHFLRLPLPTSLYKKILSRIHTDVLPKVTQPVLLCDFLTDSYNVGGIVSLLALNGIFVLMTKHNLDYPQFYDKLYQLFTPTVCFAAHRSQFFKLSSIFLSSKHLPAYIVASFLKRMGRLCLVSSPHVCIILMVMMYNLLLRHPACHALLHREVKDEDEEEETPEILTKEEAVNLSRNGEPVLLLGAAAAKNIEEAKSSKKRKVEKQENKGDKRTEEGASDIGAAIVVKPDVYKGGDPFDNTVQKLTDTHALSSCLWELGAMGAHYSPEVVRMSKLFERKMALQKQTIVIGDFLQGSYTAFVDAHAKKQAKAVPLEHEVPDEFWSEEGLQDYLLK
tara:strand:+ start:2010 stop:3989 length:1980 start_codon:yes stop_codon:yes gene_type:complete